MSMVDGVALVVDATEGPMTQTRFVLSKALSRNLKPLVVMNKADRPTARPTQVENDLFDLFATLGATDDQMEYPLLYASAKQGWAQLEAPDVSANESATDTSPESEEVVTTRMMPLFDTILDHVPPPSHLSRTEPFSMLTVQIESDPYVGMLYLGRIQSGVLRVGDNLLALDTEGNKCGEGKVKKLFSRVGMERVEREAAGAGEIISIAGIKMNKGGGVNVSLVAPDGWGEEGPKPLETTPIDPPTISMFVYPNDAPFAGREGNKLTSQLIRDRIYKEAETNVALKVLPGPTSESLELRGRGVLHLGVLFETLRREGFELTIGPPKAVMKPNPDAQGKKGLHAMLEPIESCTINVKEEYAGKVIEKLTMRKGEMTLYENGDPQEGWVKIEMDIPARGLIGYMAGEFKNDVHGEGTLNHFFKAYEPYKGAIDTGRSGSLICMALGESSAYAMAPLQARGLMFIHPQTNAADADEKIVISSPKVMNLEESMAYMADDELVEITPQSIRLRKTILDPDKRKRMSSSSNKA
ncbi:hypothetical protein V5O48_017499 [Marasmius crinis-equi]|uniref:Elongation factor EFG domain-containing protein n=1 Tax=Marasmius crinis-equi TaxID=585013 RepID=A0ABR3ENU1_9AGAR